MDNRLSFDIIMPTFKRQHCINSTIDTILKQSYHNWRLIIIDNDGTMPYNFTDDRIECHIHNKTKGAAYARNCGIQYAKSDVVCFFDDDDYMHESYLDEFSRAFVGNIKMVTCWMDANHNKNKLRYATPCCVTKKEFIKPMWKNCGQLQDQKYFKSIIKDGQLTINNIEHIDKILVFVGHSSDGGLRHVDGDF